jgi:hypothetical protein
MQSSMTESASRISGLDDVSKKTMQYFSSTWIPGAHPEPGTVIHAQEKRMIFTSFAAIRSRISVAGIAIASLPLVGCLDKPDDVSQSEQAVGTPSVNQVPLDPTTIPQFASQLPIRGYSPRP